MSERFTCEEEAEVMRKKHHYRELILSGKLVLPYSSAARLLGPDCLYHLYSMSKSEAPRPGRAKPGNGKKPVKRRRGS